MVTSSLIEDFFKNKCTPGQRQEVAAYLEANPEVLEKYLSETEWEFFIGTEIFPPEITQKIQSRVFEQITTGKAGKRHGIVRAMPFLRAASIILFFAAGWLLFHRGKSSRPSMHSGEILASAKRSDHFQHVHNSKAEKIIVPLSDGSQIELFPESEVYYTDNLTGMERAIHLVGKASFQVAPDKTRPFVVYSDEVTTTALGTSFTVTDFEQDNTIKVRLNNGKVVVKSLTPAAVKWAGGKYLSPGDLLVYTKRDRLARVISPHKFMPGVALTHPNGASLPDWYMFDALPLDQVLDQLSLYYGVEIDYNPTDVRKKFFTGKYENKDSLDVILHDIGLLNQLSVTQKDEVYRIRKKNSD